RPAVLHLVLAQGRLDVALRRLTLRAQAAARDGAGGVALDVRDLAVLHVHELAAADGAVRADRLHHVVGVVDARFEALRPRRLDRRSQAEWIAFAELPERRPGRDQIAERHGLLVPLPPSSKQIGLRYVCP